MKTTIAGTLLFDTDGFCQANHSWSEDTAQHIAAMDGIGPLNERQLKLLNGLRQHYLHLGALPALPHVCRACGFGPDCMHQLFPNAYEAWRIAGLPNPGDEAVAYL